MMRKLILSILLFFIPMISHSHVRITYTGDPLPKKAVEKIEAMIGYMGGYYSALGLTGSMDVELKVFKTKKEGYRYMRSLYPGDQRYIEQPHDKTMGGGVGGVYIPARKMAVVLGMEHGTDAAISLIDHEMSHHFTRMLFANSMFAPVWLNEGLAEHFGALRVKKSGVVSEFPHADRGKVKTMIMLGDLNLPKFLDFTQKEFSQMHRYEGQTCYSLAHVIVTVLMENLSTQQMGELVEVLKKRKRDDKVSSLVDSVYPGGLQSLEKGILEFVSK